MAVDHGGVQHVGRREASHYSMAARVGGVPSAAMTSCKIRAVPALLCSAGALAIAGCGSTATKTVTVSTPQTAATSAATTQSAAPGTTGTTSGTTSTPVTTTTPTPSQPPTRFVHLAFFRTPSGNIGCAIADGTARCDVRQRDWSPPPRSASCPSIVDYGQGLIVGRSGPATFVCAGDTALDPSAPALAYGSASQVGDFVCVSRSAGTTCTDRFNGHGFFINRQGYRLF